MTRLDSVSGMVLLWWGVAAGECSNNTNDSRTGGILLYAHGRTATESYYKTVMNIAGSEMRSLFDSHLGGESWKNIKGVPTDAFNVTLAANRRYAHVKPKHIFDGQGRDGKVQTDDELFRLAKAAGFTLVVVIYRSNELAWLMSNLEFSRFLTGNTPVSDAICRDSEMLLEGLDESRRQIRRGIIAARNAGFPVLLATFEDIVRDTCSVATTTIEIYNSVSGHQVCKGSSECASEKTVSHSHPPRPFSDRVDEKGRSCLDKIMADTAFAWMVEDDAMPLDPPSTWRRFFDGLDVVDGGPPVFYSNASFLRKQDEDLQTPETTKWPVWVRKEA